MSASHFHYPTTLPHNSPPTYESSEGSSGSRWALSGGESSLAHTTIGAPRNSNGASLQETPGSPTIHEERSALPPYPSPSPLPEFRDSDSADLNAEELLFLCLLEEFNTTWRRLQRKALEFHLVSQALQHWEDKLSDYQRQCLAQGNHDLATNIEDAVGSGGHHD
ncbi:hypothetical protein NMY22_g14500 [Coprinellus aureogranulatus]|nr:hypothetical protein NMY22_g14500 [Coprinellus aureogranulatus]